MRVTGKFKHNGRRYAVQAIDWDEIERMGVAHCLDDLGGAFSVEVKGLSGAEIQASILAAVEGNQQ